MKTRLTSAALVAAMAASSSAESICHGRTEYISFTLAYGEKCLGERFGTLCSVDCSKKHVKREKLESKLRKAPKPKIGKVYSYSEAKQLSIEWNDEKIEKLIVEMDGKLNNDERHVIRGALKKWPMVKFYAHNIGVDPRLVYLTFITESRWMQVKGSSGEKSEAQLMPSTAMSSDLKEGRHSKYYDRSKKWYEGDNPTILAIYYLREAVRAVGCEGIPFDELSAQQLLYIYHFYNKGTTNYEPTWQQSNFANSAMNLMWTYKFVEKQHALSAPQLYAVVGKLMGEHDKRKETSRVVNSATEHARVTEQSKRMASHKESVAMFNSSMHSGTKPVETRVNTSSVVKEIAPTQVISITSVTAISMLTKQPIVEKLILVKKPRTNETQQRPAVSVGTVISAKPASKAQTKHSNKAIASKSKPEQTQFQSSIEQLMKEQDALIQRLNASNYVSNPSRK